MIECMLVAPSSGSGKTAVTCALLAALEKRGMAPCAFKCGPDYIDPMFHRSVLGVDSHNLDLFLCDETPFLRFMPDMPPVTKQAVTEGVMGFYDGVGGVTDRASAWHVAHTEAAGSAGGASPWLQFDACRPDSGPVVVSQESGIVGILLNDCAPMLAQSLIPMLEQQTGLPVLGFLPHMPEAVFESRHLGLLTAGEIQNLSARMDVLARQLEQTVDVDRLLSLCRRPARPAVPHTRPAARAVIAVARDEAFCFAYEETLDALRQAGAELAFFSPLRDEQLPRDAGGMYLPGGYPELYAGPPVRQRGHAPSSAPGLWNRECPPWRNAAAFVFGPTAGERGMALAFPWQALCRAAACGKTGWCALDMHR